MFRFFRKKKKNTAEEKLDQISKLLFPHYETQKDDQGRVFVVDYSVDSNIFAALMDLQDGNNDPIVHDILDHCNKQLMEAREILDAYSILNKKAEYVIVDHHGSNKEILG